MKIGIFDPYLDTLGGGERYILTIAAFLAKGNQVEIFWDDPKIVQRISSFLNIDTSRVKTHKNIFKSNSLINKFLETRKYDLIIYISDGSIPFLFGKKNILIFQFPVNWVKGKNLITKTKLSSIDSIICYSNFVKEYLDRSFGVNSRVLEPPVNIDFEKKKKENVILSVGRFTRGINTKNQLFLIEQFKKSSKKEFKDWKLILAGSNLPQDDDFVKSIKSQAEGYPIQVYSNVDYSKLRDLYSRAKIYWHAAGFGADLKLNPEKAEHFGISTLEAMAAGAVPVVFNGGGLKETVEEQKDGFLWDSGKQIVEKTAILIDDPDLLLEMSKRAVKKASKYSEEEFYRKIKKIIY